MSIMLRLEIMIWIYRIFPFPNIGGKCGNRGRFYFLGSKITVDGDYSHEIKRHLLLGRKAIKNLDSILKSRDITLQTKVRIVKAMLLK